MGIEFTKEGLDLLLDKRDEMLKIAECLEIPANKIFMKEFALLTFEDFTKARKTLGIETYNVTTYYVGDTEEKNYFSYRGIEFYYFKFRKQV